MGKTKMGFIYEGDMQKHDKIRRYISLSQFLDIVENKRLTFTKVSCWEDTWEAPTRKLPTKREDGQLEYALWSIEDDWFGQCWSRDVESDAMWRIYSKNQEGISIRTTVSMFDQLSEIKYGMVAPVLYYDNLTEFLPKIAGFHHYKGFYGGFLKRRAFEHENEIRIITINDERSIGIRYRNTKHIFFTIDPIQLIEAITIDPRASDWYVDVLKTYCRRAGFHIVPDKSKLYSDDIFEQTRLVQQWIPVNHSSSNKVT